MVVMAVLQCVSRRLVKRTKGALTLVIIGVSAGFPVQFALPPVNGVWFKPQREYSRARDDSCSIVA